MQVLKNWLIGSIFGVTCFRELRVNGLFLFHFGKYCCRGIMPFATCRGAAIAANLVLSWCFV